MDRNLAKQDTRGLSMSRKQIASSGAATERQVESPTHGSTAVHSRRRFLNQAAALGAGTVLATAGSGPVLPAGEPVAAGPDGRPLITRPRSTSGDTRSDVNWAERLTMTVGPRDAQLVGHDDKVIQAAVDLVARLGGGIVQLSPGEYRLRNAVTLASNVTLRGAGVDTVLIKEPSVTTKLAADSDWYDQEITLKDPSGFRVGDGICLRTRNPHNGGMDVCKRTLVARDGARFRLDRPLRQNFWLMGDTTVSTLFPLVTGEYINDIVVENLRLDGNRAHNDNLDGNYAGCVFLQDCSRVLLKDLDAGFNNGDGLSWQIVHDCTVENCYSHDHAGLGLHPGSGSQRPLMRNNRLEDNHIGIFFCWGVKWGLAEGNRLRGNRFSVSIGHRDTDNIVRGNEIVDSGEVGVIFRPERGEDFAPHRCRIEGNTIINSGHEAAAAIDVQGLVTDVLIAGNTISERRAAAQRIGVRLGPDVGQIALENNRIDGFADDVVRMAKKA